MLSLIIIIGIAFLMQGFFSFRQMKHLSDAFIEIDRIRHQIIKMAAVRKLTEIAAAEMRDIEMIIAVCIEAELADRGTVDTECAVACPV